uniref:Uncharacterized protein n=1 Tax=Octopus bimaculoides TaxID=37653 RepID=A0A0L8GRY8_OCTBM
MPNNKAILSPFLTPQPDGYRNPCAELPVKSQPNQNTPLYTFRLNNIPCILNTLVGTEVQ